MLAVAIILAVDAVAALMIGTFLFRSRARDRMATGRSPETTGMAVALAVPTVAVPVTVADPFRVASIPEPAAVAPERVPTRSGLIDVIPPAPTPEPVAPAPAPQSVPPTDAVAARPTPGAGETSRTVPSRQLLLAVGAGLVLGAVVLARRR